MRENVDHVQQNIKSRGEKYFLGKFPGNVCPRGTQGKQLNLTGSEELTLVNPPIRSRLVGGRVKFSESNTHGSRGKRCHPAPGVKELLLLEMCFLVC